MQATITKHYHTVDKRWFWRVDIGMGHTTCFPVETPKSKLIDYANSNGAESVKFFMNRV